MRKLLTTSDARAPTGDLQARGQAGRPADAEERIDAIDVVRGVALFGVLTVNLLMGFRTSIFAQFVPGPLTGGLSRWVEDAVEAVLELKAFALFSLLFGVGLAMQFERLQPSGRPFHFLLRRLLALLGFGLVHLVFIWNGDILIEYAIAALCLLPWLRAPRWVPLLSSAVFLLLYAEAPLMPSIFAWPDGSTLSAAVDAARHVYPSCTPVACWHQNMKELPLIWPLHLFIFPRTLGLVLLGAWMWRSGAIRAMGQRRGRLLLVAIIAIAAGAWLTCEARSRSLVDVTWLADLVAAMGPVALAVGYGGAIAWLALRHGGGVWLRPMARVGRMAFSNYIVQSLAFCGIFYGYGLGLFDRVDATMAFAMGTALFALQAALSTFWLHHYRFGPLEWLWRVLMYGRWQPMLRTR